MEDDTRQFLDEEVEFVYNEQTFIYRFRDSRISFRRIWNTPGHTLKSDPIGSARSGIIGQVMALLVG